MKRDPEDLLQCVEVAVPVHRQVLKKSYSENPNEEVRKQVDETS